MQTVTGEEVKNAMIAAGIERVELRNCSMCGYPLAFIRKGENLFIDTGCDCMRAPPKASPVEWDEAANSINEYPDMRQPFGLEKAI